MSPEPQRPDSQTWESVRISPCQAVGDDAWSTVGRDANAPVGNSLNEPKTKGRTPLESVRPFNTTMESLGSKAAPVNSEAHFFAPSTRDGESAGLTDKERALLVAAKTYQDQRDAAMIIVRDLVQLVDGYALDQTQTAYWNAKAAELVENARAFVAFHDQPNENL